MKFLKEQKILLVRFSSLGDVLLTTPLIRSLKKLNNNFEIDFIIKEQFKDVVSNNPYIRKVFAIKNFNELKRIKNKLIENKYDIVINLQNNFRSRKFVKGISPKIFGYKKENINKFLLVNFKINRLQNIIPTPVRYANSIPGFRLDNEGLELFIPENIKPTITEKPDTIGFCPGSVHKTKMWPEEYFIKLGNMFSEKGYRIILFGGKSDRQICSRISGKIFSAIDASNDNKLFETSVNMKLCKTVICNDSGLMHTAVANKVPVVALFGSTVKEFGFAPYKSKSLVIENSLLRCRPCTHIGLNECPKKHFDCMKTLTPEFVFNKTLNFLKTI